MSHKDTTDISEKKRHEKRGDVSLCSSHMEQKKPQSQAGDVDFGDFGPGVVAQRRGTRRAFFQQADPDPSTTAT